MESKRLVIFGTGDFLPADSDQPAHGGARLNARVVVVMNGTTDATPQVDRRFEGMVKLVYNAVYRVQVKQ